MGASGRLASRLVVFAGLLVLSALPVRADAPGTYGDVYRWYFRAAEAGDPEAQLLLGIRYESGVDFEQSDEKAADWYERAARQGLPEAQFKLAVMLAEGRGRLRSLPDALEWYRKAAQQNYAPAQYNLGVHLLEQAGTPDEHVSAMSWILRAARAGIEPAQGVFSRAEARWPAELIARAREAAEAPLGQAPR